MCLYPKLVKNPKYKATKKNGGNIPEMKDMRVGYVPVGCGHCMECMKQKANWWRLRLTEDVKQYTNGKFVTLTFSNEAFTRYANKTKAEGYTLDNEVATMAVREFLERWRKKYKKSVRHWLVTELGGNGTENVHLHGIIWVDDVNAIEERWNAGKDGPNGWVWKGKKKGSQIINYVSDRTANYITKYICKVDTLHRYYKPKVLCSPGIGASYKGTKNYKLNKYEEGKTREEYVTKQGRKMGMPIYWRNKLYTDEEKEKLWIEKIEKGKRYVGGEEIEADNEEGYYKLLKHYREKNYRLGYGSPTDWDAIEYEKTRRKLLHDKRKGET